MKNLVLYLILLLVPTGLWGQEKLRITVMTPQMMRLQYDASGEGVAYEAVEGVVIKHEEKDGYLYVETSVLKLRYLVDSEIIPDSKSADELRISFLLRNHNVIWYPGKDDAMNLRGMLPSMGGRVDDTQRDSLSLGVLSRAGWSVIKVAEDEAHFDWLFMGYGRNYMQALTDFRRYGKELLPSSPVCQMQPGSWSELAFAPCLAATASNVCVDCQGVGWDSIPEPSRIDGERYLRWMQLSAFMQASSVALPDSVIRERLAPFDEAEALLEARELHRHTRPLIDSLFAEQVAVCRPLYYAFPEENNAYVYEDEFLVGDSLLVAPITRPAQEDGLARRRVWLPPGRWHDVVNHRWQEGPCLVNVECSLYDIPYFILEK